MSKIASKKINLGKVKCQYNNHQLHLSYGTHEVTIPIHEKISITIQQDIIITESNEKYIAICGTMNRIINNMIQGLQNPFKKFIKLEGTGYKGSCDNNIIIFNLGYSHKIQVPVPKDVNVKFNNPTSIELSSINRASVGNFTEKLTQYRPHNPYSGKGILRTDKIYIRKETKRK